MKLIEKLENLGAEETDVKGGSLAGAESRALVKSLELGTLVYRERIFQTPRGDIKIGSEVLERLSVEYLALKNEENLLTSQQQAICILLRESIRNLDNGQPEVVQRGSPWYEKNIFQFIISEYLRVQFLTFNRVSLHTCSHNNLMSHGIINTFPKCEIRK